MYQTNHVPLTWHSYLDVDLDAIRGNIRYLGRHTVNGTKQMAVVKGDAYGHGAAETALGIVKEVSWFGVANISEGIELRKAGIRLPILVFGVPTRLTAPLYESWNLTASVSHLSHFDLLPESTEAHLHFDTGMNRLGLRPEQLADVKSIIPKKKISVTGVMSHLACSDDPESQITADQIARAKALFSEFPTEYERHIHNSGGILYHYDPQFSLVRHGIAMYGYDPGPQPNEHLKPALTWKSAIVQCKPIKKGETISYGAKWEAGRDGWLLTVPVGYADGLPRNLTDKITYEIGGEKLPVRGTVTMDYTMLFSDKPVSEGTEVVVMGGASNDARTLADASSTITYEIVTRLAPKVPRVYKKS